MENNQIKAIETYYNGYRFRSRLEARWAVFFDEIGVKYEYEPQGFDLGNGLRYLPDFYLPQFDYFVEVKGENDHLPEDMRKIDTFVKKSKMSVMYLTDIPYSEESSGLYLIPVSYYVSKSRGCVGRCYGFFGIDYNDNPRFYDTYEVGNFRWEWRGLCNIPDTSKKKIMHSIRLIRGEEKDNDEFSVRCAFPERLKPIQKAILKARQARFEHGETPNGGV